MRRLGCIGWALALLPSAAVAEVKSQTPTGFAVERIVTIAAPPETVYATLVRPALWWDAAHSYSGNAANMSIDPRPGGCFCESLPGGGGVEHMRVVYVAPGKALRLRGGLGPLQAEGVEGALSWSLAAEGKGTKVTQSYVVGGYVRAGMDKLAGPVDGVLGEQLMRLKSAIERPAK